jgi:hypothetical protein
MLGWLSLPILGSGPPSGRSRKAIQASLVPGPCLEQAIFTPCLRGHPIMDKLCAMMASAVEPPLHGHVDLAPQRQTI